MTSVGNATGPIPKGVKVFNASNNGVNKTYMAVTSNLIFIYYDTRKRVSPD